MSILNVRLFTAVAGFYLALVLGGLVPTCSAFRAAGREASQPEVQVDCDEARRNLGEQAGQQGYHANGQKDLVNGSKPSSAAPCPLETVAVKKTSTSSHEEAAEPEPPLPADLSASMEDEDDMLPPPPEIDTNSFIDLYQDPSHDKKYFGGRVRLWPNRTVLYRWGKDIDPLAKQASLEAMEAWQAKTCIKFELLPDFKNHYDKVSPVEIKSDDGPCRAHVGCIHSYKQSLNLGPRCRNFGNALHEIGHVIGLEHEHNRASRDDFIFINKKHIRVDRLTSFTKQPSDLEAQELKGVPYDMSSIMHYGPWQFSREHSPQYNNPDTRSIQVKKADDFGNCEMGQRARISRGDIMTVAAMYGCGDMPSITDTETWNELLNDEDCKDKAGKQRWDCSTIAERTMAEGPAYCESSEVQKECPRGCGICTLTTPMCYASGRHAMAKFSDTQHNIEQPKTEDAEEDDTWLNYFLNTKQPNSAQPYSSAAEAIHDEEGEKEPTYFHSEGSTNSIKKEAKDADSDLHHQTAKAYHYDETEDRKEPSHSYSTGSTHSIKKEAKYADSDLHHHAAKAYHYDENEGMKEPSHSDSTGGSSSSRSSSSSSRTYTSKKKEKRTLPDQPSFTTEASNLKQQAAERHDSKDHSLGHQQAEPAGSSTADADGNSEDWRRIVKKIERQYKPYHVVW